MADRRHDIPTAELGRLYRSGETIRGLAKRFGCSVHLVHGRLRSIGCPRRPRGKPAAEFKVIEGRYAAGEPLPAIARDLGITLQAAYNRLRRHGVAMRPRWPRAD